MTRPRTATFEYVTGKKYDGMMGRCYRETDASYKRYGAKGVRVCAAWIKDIDNFRAWVRAHLTAIGLPLDEFVARGAHFQLDRVDGGGHYTPANCRVVSAQANARNKGGRTRVYMSSEGESVAV